MQKRDAKEQKYLEWSEIRDIMKYSKIPKLFRSVVELISQTNSHDLSN